MQTKDITTRLARAAAKRSLAKTAPPSARSARWALTLIIALLTTATAWADNVVTLSVDGDIAEGTAGHYYVNMPATGTKTLTLTEQDITDGKGTFKVYDDGGKSGNYSASCNGYLTIVVPENCTLQLSGEVKLTRTTSTNESSANPIFKIFNGGSTGTQIASVWGSTNYGPGYERNIGTLDSSGNTITLYLYNDKTPGYSNSNASGVDITVTVISPDMEYAVNIADGILNGSVTADPTSAEGGTTISLTATPESGYLLNGISVTDANSNAVGITCAPWYATGDAANQATFTMPNSAVTVTPTFTAINNTNNAFSIRVPKTGAEAATIPDGIVSFKVYDNGGPGGSYGPNCDGTLTLTAPTGWGLQVAGSVDVGSNDSGEKTVTITDGTNRLYSANYTTETMSPVISSSGTLTIAIKSDNSDFHYGRAGIDLTVTMVDLSQPHSVTVGSASNGSMTASPVSATAGPPVTLTAVPASGYRLGSVTVTYDGDKPVTVSGTGNDRTFTMPYADVTVTPVFEPANADGGPIISGLNYVGSNGDAPGYYVINSASALNALATYVNGGNSAEGMLFRQTADIDMQGAGFTPIGDAVDRPFAGTFDGDGYVILNISHSDDFGYSGLFGRLVGTAKNVSLKDCSFSGVRAGGIAGAMYGGHIVNCNVLGGTAYCPAGGFSGGIVGYVNSATGSEVGGCFTTATVSAAAVDANMNGPVAGNTAGWIHDNYYTVSVSTNDWKNGTKVTVYGITLGDGVTMTGNFRTVGRTAANTYHFGKQGDAVTLSHNRAGYAANYSSDDVTITDGAFTMPAADATVTATFTPDPAHFSDDGGDEYTIHTAEGWGVFCDALQDNTTYNRFTDKTVRLGANIGSALSPVTRMAGSDKHDFCGTFDGDEHIITLDGNSANGCYTLFRNAVGTTIRDLHVTGTITTAGKYAAGFISGMWGNVTIENCRSSVIISSSVSGDGTHGGFVAVNNSGTLDITGCIFDGKLLTEGATATSHCGGFVGWNGGTLTITNSLYAPATLGTGETEVIDGDSNPSATFSRNGATITNSYYTRALGTEQGVGYNFDTAPTNIGTAGTAYSVSGITPYTRGIGYGGRYYMTPEAVSLSDTETNDVDAISNYFVDVTLADRTLYKDGKWNTLCLPFDVTAAQIAAHTEFAGAEIRELSSASFDGGTLTLNFTPATGEGAVTGITAGRPCIVRWQSGSNFTPTFSGVTIDATARNKACDLGDGKSITFRGTYAPLTYADENKGVLFLGSDNTLYYPDGTGTTTIGSCRAYFALSGLTAGDKASQARAFVLNFGDEETGITTTDFTDSTDKAGAWYDMSGRRLSGKPTKSGVYVNNGHKIVIK